MRKFAQQTQNRIVIGFLIILFTVGLALIYFIYGSRAALMGLICLGGILGPIFLILLILTIIERLLKHE